MVPDYGYDIERHFPQYFNYIVVVSFIHGRKPEYPKKATDLSQVTNKTLSHNAV